MLWVRTYQQADLGYEAGRGRPGRRARHPCPRNGQRERTARCLLVLRQPTDGCQDQAGRLAELVGLISDVAEQNPGMPVYKAVLAWAYHEAGDEGTARDLLEAAGVNGFSLPKRALGSTLSSATASIAVQQHLPQHCSRSAVPFFRRTTTRCPVRVSRRENRSPCTWAVSRRTRGLRIRRALLQRGRGTQRAWSHALCRGTDLAVAGAMLLARGGTDATEPRWALRRSAGCSKRARLPLNGEAGGRARGQ